MLKGFKFKDSTGLHKLLLQQPALNINESGKLHLNLAACATNDLFKMVPKADRVQLQLMVHHFDINRAHDETFCISDLDFSLQQSSFPGAQLEVTTRQDGENILLVAIGIRYFNSTMQVKDRRYHTAQIIEALHLKDGRVVEYTVLENHIEPKSNELEGDKISWTVSPAK